ncbi:hypothetical protein SAMN02745229_01148 [Butyrivibrio fibrisolvens DSM 3071]|uniref:Uncharacterized protein n=1 Tax=Butyrivibrio fibrisolvens DSM 3071 TaxID=1121131 RepID=A0A1M5WSP6_BUTFI|nr:hypothetical protein [Butyrivibrio fibrisolvens]SHH90488.1 hypothetical protein SAMN02745229_01148 [Butyrivibrio fibrisolvens DSM 3071]
MRGYLTKKVPKTIDDLKKYCKERNLNSDVTRFYIDVDHIGPDAYGIYKDYWSDDFIVYKNTDDGSREIIYQGKDEAIAVNELGRRLSIFLKNPEMLDELDLAEAEKETQEETLQNEFSSGTSFVSSLRSEYGADEDTELNSENEVYTDENVADSESDQDYIEDICVDTTKNVHLKSFPIKTRSEQIYEDGNDEDYSIHDEHSIDQETESDDDRYTQYHYDLFPKEYTINKKKPNKDKLEKIKVALLFIIAIMAIIFFGLYSVTNGFTNTDRDNYNNAYYDSYYKSYFSSDNYDCADLPGPMNGSYYTPDETHYLAEQIEKRWSERFR